MRSGWLLGAVRVLWTRVMVWLLWVGVVGEVGVGRWLGVSGTHGCAERENSGARCVCRVC